MTTLDLGALERAARAAADGDWLAGAEERIAFRKLANPAAILSLISDYRALQERVEGAEKALNLIDALDPEEAVYGCSHDAARGLVIQMGQTARAYFAARTKAGEPHDEG